MNWLNATIRKLRPNIWEVHDEQAINVSAILASETSILDLSAVITRYKLDSLFLKSADPGSGNYVKITLYRLINGSLTAIQTYTLNSTNYDTYYSLNDLFGMQSMSGDNIKITVQQMTGGGPTAITGSYVYRSNDVR